MATTEPGLFIRDKYQIFTQITLLLQLFFVALI